MLSLHVFVLDLLANCDVDRTPRAANVSVLPDLFVVCSLCMYANYLVLGPPRLSDLSHFAVRHAVVHSLFIFTFSSGHSLKSSSSLLQPALLLSRMVLAVRSG